MTVGGVNNTSRNRVDQQRRAQQAQQAKQAKPSQSAQQQTSPSQNPTGQTQTADAQTQHDSRKAALAQDQLAQQQRIGLRSNNPASGPALGGLQNRPAAAPKSSETKNPLPGNDQVFSADADVRHKAMTDIQSRAASGDREAIDKLKSFGEFSTMWKNARHLDHKTQDAMKQQGLDGLKGAKEHLTAEDHKNMSRTFGKDNDLNNPTADFLAQQANAGRPGALDALREGADASGYDRPEASANALADVDEGKLAPDDYKRMAKQVGNPLDDRAEKALRTAIKENRPGAADAARGMLHDASSYNDADAADIINKNAIALDNNDVAKLSDIATSGSQGNDQAIDALGRAASGTPPNPDAVKALADVAAHHGAGADAENILHHSDKARVSDWMDKAWKNPASRDALADSMVRYGADEQNAADAVGIVKQRAQQGDAAAMHTLAAGTDRDDSPVAKDEARNAITDLAENGQAQEATDALLKRANTDVVGNGSPYAKSKDGRPLFHRNERRGGVMQALGESAANLANNDPRLSDVRETLQRGAAEKARGQQLPTDTQKGAARGMSAMADKLGRPEIDALMKHNMGTDAANAVKDIAPNLDDKNADEVVDKLLTGTEQGFSDGGAEAVALGGFAERMSSDHVQRLAESRDKGYGIGERVNNTLAEVAQQNPDAAAKGEAAMSLLSASNRTLTAKGKDALVDFAVQKNDPLLSAAVDSRLTAEPMSDAKLKNVAERYTSRLSGAIRTAEKGSDMERLGTLYRMRGMSTNEDHGENVSTKKIDAEIQRISGKSPLKDQLEKIRQGAIGDATGSQDPAGDQAAYMKSDDFQRRMKLQGQKQGTKMMRQELSKLAMVDPAQAREVGDTLAQKALQNSAVDLFKKADTEKTTNAINGALSQLKTATGLSGKTMDLLNNLEPAQQEAVSRAIDSAFRRAGGNQAKDVLDQLKDAKPGTPGAKAFGIIDDLTKNGRFGTFSAGVSLAALATGKTPETTEEWGRMTSEAMGIAGNASAVGKLFDVGNLRKAGDGLGQFGDLTKFGKAAKIAEFLGPVGDVIGAGFDSVAAYQEFQKGDQVGGWSNSVSAGAGVASAVAGIAIVAGASGPLAPAVVLGGAVIALGAAGFNALFGESDEESFLRRGYKNERGQEVNFWVG